MLFGVATLSSPHTRFRFMSKDQTDFTFWRAAHSQQLQYGCLGQSYYGQCSRFLFKIGSLKNTKTNDSINPHSLPPGRRYIFKVHLRAGTPLIQDSLSDKHRGEVEASSLSFHILPQMPGRSNQLQTTFINI